MKTDYLKILIFVLAGGISLSGQAQQLSMQDAMKRALQKNPKIAVKEAAFREAATDYEKKKHAYIPEIEAEAGMQRNFVISATPVPAKMFYPDAPDGEIYPAKFGTKYSGSAGINLSYNLFQPERVESLSMERSRKVVSQIEIEEEKEKIMNRVRLDYAAVLLADKQLQLCAEDTASVRAALEYVEVRLEKGEANRQEQLTAQMDLNESMMKWENALAVVRKAKQALLADMGEDVFEENVEQLQLANSLEEVMRMIEEEVNMKWGSLEAAKDMLQMRIAKKDWKRAKWGFFPTLSLTGYYGSGYYGPHLHVTDGKYWYGSSYLGIKLTVPISKIADRVSELKRSRAAFLKARYEARDRELERNLKMSGYRVDMQNAKQAMEFAARSVRLAKEKYEIEKSALDVGKIYPAKLREEGKMRFEKEVSYIQAVYDYFIAAANYLLIAKG